MMDTIVGQYSKDFEIGCGSSKQKTHKQERFMRKEGQLKFGNGMEQWNSDLIGHEGCIALMPC